MPKYYFASFQIEDFVIGVESIVTDNGFMYADISL